MYVVSKRLLIHNKFFARRFNTRKQAEAYMTSSGFDRNNYSSEELKIETEKKQQSNIKEKE